MQLYGGVKARQRVWPSLQTIHARSDSMSLPSSMMILACKAAVCPLLCSPVVETSSKLDEPATA